MPQSLEIRRYSLAGLLSFIGLAAIPLAAARVHVALGAVAAIWMTLALAWTIAIAVRTSHDTPWPLKQTLGEFVYRFGATALIALYAAFGVAICGALGAGIGGVLGMIGELDHVLSRARVARTLPIRQVSAAIIALRARGPNRSESVQLGC